MDQKKYHGGSASWWPPAGDHVFLYKANPLRFEYFDRFMGSWKNVRVLDVGCGGGYTCEFLARRRAVVFGTDIMAESLRQACDHAVLENLDIRYRLGTAERLPFDDQMMDAVTCFDVLEHIPGKVQILGEIHRVLKPGGWLFFDTFNKTIWSRLVMIWFGEILIRFIPRGTHYWPYFVPPGDMKLLLAKSGFVNMEIGGIKSAVPLRRKDNLPVRISSRGNTAVVYFGAARKPRSGNSEA